ncbi:MAG: MFS transporter [Acidimicrobiia bacterium]
MRGRDLILRGPFARLWWANTISSIGDWITLFATFTLATRISGERGATIAILVPLVARILPGLAFGAIGGVVADRLDRRRTMVVADFGRALLVIGLLRVDSFQELFILSFAIEVLSLMRQPAREAVVPTLIPVRHLVAANGLNLVSAYGTAPIGSALYALIAQVGRGFPSFGSFGPTIDLAFLFDAATFLVSGIVMLTMDIESPRVPRERRTRGSFDLRAPLRDLVDGFQFVATRRAVRTVVLGMAAALFGGGAVFVLGQPFSEQVLRGGESGYGILVTALGVGVVAGMLGVTLFGSMLTRRELVVGLSLALTGVGIILTAFSGTVWGGAGWVLLAGLGTGAAYVMGFTHLHEQVTDEIRGRTFGALFAVGRAALLISFALAGLGAAALQGLLPGELNNGIRAVLALGGVVIVSAGAVTLWAVRALFTLRPLDDEALQALRDAGDAFTWVRGNRRGDRR